MLDARGLYLSFEGQRVLNGLSLSVHAGERLALIGPSGCGKTSLLRVLAGLLRADAGSVDNRFASTTIMFQEARLVPWLTAEENVRLVIPGRAEHAREAARAALARVGIADAAEKTPEELSGGMRQLVSLARTLAFGGELLLLDEPFKALDPAAKARAVRAVSDSGCGALILVTHDMREAEALACRAVDFSTLNR